MAPEQSREKHEQYTSYKKGAAREESQCVNPEHQGVGRGTTSKGLSLLMCQSDSFVFPQKHSPGFTATSKQRGCGGRGSFLSASLERVSWLLIRNKIYYTQSRRKILKISAFTTVQPCLILQLINYKRPPLNPRGKRKYEFIGRGKFRHTIPQIKSSPSQV